jgi:hypothetical protein
MGLSVFTQGQTGNDLVHFIGIRPRRKNSLMGTAKRAAETIFMALVICWVLRTELIRFLISLRFAMIIGPVNSNQ